MQAPVQRTAVHTVRAVDSDAATFNPSVREDIISERADDMCALFAVSETEVLERVHTQPCPFERGVGHGWDDVVDVRGATVVEHVQGGRGAGHAKPLDCDAACARTAATQSKTHTHTHTHQDSDV